MHRVAVRPPAVAIVLALAAQAHVGHGDVVGRVCIPPRCRRPLDPADDLRVSRESLLARHADGPQPSSWGDSDHSPPVVAGGEGSGDVAAVTVSVVQAVVVRAVGLPYHIEIGMGRIDPSVQDRHIDIDGADAVARASGAEIPVDPIYPERDDVALLDGRAPPGVERVCAEGALW